MADPDRKPFWARCGHCGHCWPAAYTPLCMATFAEIIGRVACPNCGARKRLKVARQRDGELLEPCAPLTNPHPAPEPVLGPATGRTRGAPPSPGVGRGEERRDG